MSHVLRQRERAPSADWIRDPGESLDERWDRDRGEKVHTAVALFAALVALGIAGLGWLCRFGFADNSPREWANFVGLSWFLLFFSLVVRTLLGIKGRPGPWRSWTSHAGLTLAGLALLALVGVEWGAAARNGANLAALARGSQAALFVLGGAGFVLACCLVARAASLCHIAVLLAFAVAFSVYGAAACCGSGYQNTLLVEGIPFNFCQIDELYNASLCNMLRTYGVSSTGLDGIPFVPYHFGSNWLFAQLCNLLDVRVIDFYARGYRVVFVPFGVLSLGTFAASMAQRRHRRARGAQSATAEAGVENAAFENRVEAADEARNAEDRSWPVGPLFWLIVWTGYVSFLPYPPFLTPIFAWSSIIVSESYGLGVAVSLLGLSWAWSFFQNVRARRNLWSLDIFAGVLFLAALMAAVSLLKISQSVILAAAAVFFFVRLAWYRSPIFAVCLVGVVAGVYGVHGLITPAFTQTRRFMPFEFVRTCVEPEWWPYFWLFYYAWLWIVSAIRLREEGIRTVRDLAHALRRRRLLDVEFLFVAALAGAGPAMLFIPYSSAHFFSEYQQWLALALLLSIVIRGRRPLRDRPVRSAQADGPTSWAERLRLSAWEGVTVSRVFLGAVLLTVGGMTLSNTLRLAAGLVHDNTVCRGHAGGGTGVNAALRRGRFREAAGILAQTAAEVERRFDSDKNVLKLLRSLDEMPLSEKRASLLFIPKSNRQFWQLLHGPRSPLDKPLVAPALSGVAMIDGLCDTTSETEWVAYGYPSYPRPDPSRRQPPLEEYLPILRSRCARMGFKQLIVIDQGQDGLSREQRYECLR